MRKTTIAFCLFSATMLAAAQSSLESPHLRLEVDEASGRWALVDDDEALTAAFLDMPKMTSYVIEDPDLAIYYDHLHGVIAGDLWSARRLRDLWRWLLGRSDDHLRAYVERRRSGA